MTIHPVTDVEDGGFTYLRAADLDGTVAPTCSPPAASEPVTCSS